MFKVLNLTAILLCFISITSYAQLVEGNIVDENGNSLPFVNVVTHDGKHGTSTNERGNFRLELPAGKHTLMISFLGYRKMEKQVDLSNEEVLDLSFKMDVDASVINEVEVFGSRYKQPDKMNAITRMPLRPSEQIQSISVISDKMIREQGVQTITEAVQNIPGVTLFGSYGGVRESMSIRGYRGVPVLKNGVRIDSDFRTGSALTEMQGIESVQVIKGSAAITQGLGNDLGSGGGVINIVTKTPKFTEKGTASIRTGNWGYVSPSFDFQGLLNKQKTV